MASRKRSSSVVRFREVFPQFPVDGVVTSRQLGDFSFLKDPSCRFLMYAREDFPNLDMLLFELGVPVSDTAPANIIKPSLNHGTAVSFIGVDSEKHRNTGLIMKPGGDGVLFEKPPRDKKRTIILSLSGDCPAAVISASKRKGNQQCFGILHLGRRPIAKGIIGNTAAILKKQGYLINSSQVLVTVGIGPCCYAVGEDVLGEFEKILPLSKNPSVYRKTRENKPSVDLREAALLLFKKAGFSQRAIRIMNGCTCCSTGRIGPKKGYLWYSYRRGDREKRFAIAFAL